MWEELEKEGITKWGLVKTVLSIIVIVFVLGGLGIAFKTMMFVGDRAIMVNSHQYKESMIDRAATWEAELAGINQRLTDGTLDDATRKNLEAQRAVLNVQLQSARR